ncbi:MAG: DNRLRE domain-containing protein [Myxococcota bacterium]
MLRKRFPARARKPQNVRWRSARVFSVISLVFLVSSCVEHVEKPSEVASSSRLGLPQLSASEPSTADTTLYRTQTSNSGGAGDSVFAGRNGNGDVFRALVRFDLDSVPAESTVSRVALELTIVGLPGTPRSSTMQLFRLNAAWEEGTSPGQAIGAPCADANGYGGATWDTTDCSTLWASPGGDFVSEPSAETFSEIVSTTLLWDSENDPRLLEDVSGWLEDPDANFGWLLKSDNEIDSRTARRFGSRENSEALPRLTLEYTLRNGAPCADDASCASGHCVSGVCCATGCTTPDLFACETGLPATCTDGVTCRYSDAPAGTPCADDGNPCTDDVCDQAATCVHTPNISSCDDGDLCTEFDVCSGGGCVGVPIDCDDGELCTTDSCDAGQCVNTPRSGTCDDGDPCTVADACGDDGTCVGADSPCATDLDPTLRDATICSSDSSGAYSCVCPNGYRFDDITCVDIDECAADRCGSNVRCENSAGSFTCLPVEDEGCAAVSPVGFLVLVARRRRCYRRDGSSE